MGEEEQKTPKSDQEQVKGVAKNTTEAGRTAVNTGKRAIEGSKKIQEGAKKTVEVARKSKEMAIKTAKMASKTVQLMAKMARTLITSIGALFNPLTWIIIGVIIVVLAILGLYTYLTGQIEYEDIKESFVETFKSTYTNFGEDEEETTVSGEFGKRFNFSQIDIGGPSELAMSSSGCGPTSIAMALSELANQEISPIEVAQYALSKGLYSVEVGAYGELYNGIISEFSSKYPSLSNLKMTQVSKQEDGSKEKAIEALKNGAQIVCNSGSYFPVGSGHVICICGYENGSFLVKDPNTTEAQVAKHTANQTKEPLDVGGYKIWYLDENFVHQNISNYFIYSVK